MMVLGSREFKILALKPNADEKDSHPESSIRILNPQSQFEYVKPIFLINSPNSEKIWWQISADPSFDFIPANFDQIQNDTSLVTLPLISETYFNPDQNYYFRARSFHDGKWEEWSAPFVFKLKKPAQVSLVEFYELKNKQYELDWEREAEEAEKEIEYLIYGSNSIDFIPSLYTDIHINSIVNGEVVEQEPNDNLIAVTKKKQLKVDGSLAFYRIIAKIGDQYSVPSALIRIYDNGLIQPRNALQLDEEDFENHVLKRVLFPRSYSWDSVALPEVSPLLKQKKSLIELIETIQRKVDESVDYGEFPYNPHVPQEEWNQAKKYFLPTNHPARPKLDRLFTATRVTQTPDTFRDAGFKRYRPGRFNRVMASSHPQLKEYFVKAYADSELGIKNDWVRLRHRIYGAMVINECIQKHDYQKMFKVPRKWLYPLPENPSPPNSQSFLRKNFILIAQNMRILDHKKNDKAYKNKITRPILDAMYTIFVECGLYDSVFNFNVPFTKDGPLAFIDTEYFYRWPVNLSKMSKYFSSDMKKYWEKLIETRGQDYESKQ